MHTQAVQPQKAKRDDRAACARGGVKMRAPQRQPAANLAAPQCGRRADPAPGSAAVAAGGGASYASRVPVLVAGCWGKKAASAAARPKRRQAAQAERKKQPTIRRGLFFARTPKSSRCQTTARPIRAGGKRGASTGATRSKTAPKSRAARPKARRRAVYLPLTLARFCGTQLPPLGHPLGQAFWGKTTRKKRLKAGCFAQNAQHRAAVVARCEASGVPR